jgi:hypothetical protein
MFISWHDNKHQDIVVSVVVQRQFIGIFNRYCQFERSEKRDMQKVLYKSAYLRELISMPRLARLDAPGILHHVMGRGIERKKIFKRIDTLYFPGPTSFTPTLQKSEGFRVPGDGISASLQQGVWGRSSLLQALSNAESEVLRLSRRVGRSRRRRLKGKQYA